MSIWFITVIGVSVVFLVLWVLAEVINWGGKYFQPSTSLPEAETALQTRAEPEVPRISPGTLSEDIPIIAAVMKHQGITGDLKISRLDNN